MRKILSMWILIRYWFEKRLQTDRPIPFIICIFTCSWAVVLSFQVQEEHPITSWTILLERHSPNFWITVWVSLAIYNIVTLTVKSRLWHTVTMLISAYVWFYTGYVLLQGQITLSLGTNVIMGLLSLWVVYLNHVSRKRDRFYVELSDKLRQARNEN